MILNLANKVSNLDLALKASIETQVVQKVYAAAAAIPFEERSPALMNHAALILQNVHSSFTTNPIFNIDNIDPNDLAP